MPSPSPPSGKKRAEVRRADGSLVSRLFLPADLLSRFDGVYQSLQQGQRVERHGWFAFLFSATTALVTVFTTSWWHHLVHLQWSEVAKGWPLILVVAVGVVSVVLVNWTRIWVSVSRRPFRYTYSIEDFRPVEGTKPVPRLAWLLGRPPRLRRFYIFHLFDADPAAPETWTRGAVYAVPRAGFRREWGNEWVSAKPVRPVLRVLVGPEDFSLRHAVRAR